MKLESYRIILPNRLSFEVEDGFPFMPGNCTHEGKIFWQDNKKKRDINSEYLRRQGIDHEIDTLNIEVD